MATPRPAGWKNYDDFAHGIATNRLPNSQALIGQHLDIHFSDHSLSLQPQSATMLSWTERGQDGEQHGQDRYEAVEVAPDTYFIDLLQAARPQDALTIIVNTRSLRVLAVRCHVQSEAKAGTEPRVQQTFMVGTLGSDPTQATGMEPHESRDLIGLRTFQRYSPEHCYEHTYLNSQRYAWQCLQGVQRGHGDVDLASYYQFDHQQYIFTFREFIIPVASVFFFNFSSNRSTGKFLGITGAGQIANNPAGAFIEKASVTTYFNEQQPV